jgi:hypothetical protein
MIATVALNAAFDVTDDVEALHAALLAAPDVVEPNALAGPHCIG